MSQGGVNAGESSPGETGAEGPSPLRRGLRAGLGTSLRLLRVMLPFSMGFDMLARLGLLAEAGRFAAPLMAPFALPGEAAIAIVTGLLLNLYGAVAAVPALRLTPAQVTVLGLMLGLAHTLPVEMAVLRAAGTRWGLLLAYRLSMLVLLGLAASGAARWLGFALPVGALRPSAPTEHLAVAAPGGLLALVGGSALTAIRQTLQIVLIVVPILTAYEVFRSLPSVQRAGGRLSPSLARFGVSQGGAVALFGGLSLGIVYGGGIILRARESHDLGREEVFRIALVLCTCHAVLEDTLLFVRVGGSFLWIAGVRGALAAILLLALAPRGGRSPGTGAPA